MRQQEKLRKTISFKEIELFSILQLSWLFLVYLVCILWINTKSKRIFSDSFCFTMEIHDNRKQNQIRSVTLYESCILFQQHEWYAITT